MQLKSGEAENSVLSKENSHLVNFDYNHLVGLSEVDWMYIIDGGGNLFNQWASFERCVVADGGSYGILL